MVRQSQPKCYDLIRPLRPAGNGVLLGLSARSQPSSRKPSSKGYARYGQCSTLEILVMTRYQSIPSKSRTLGSGQRRRWQTVCQPCDCKLTNFRGFRVSVSPLSEWCLMPAPSGRGQLAEIPNITTLNPRGPRPSAAQAMTPFNGCCKALAFACQRWRHEVAVSFGVGHLHLARHGRRA